MSKSVRNGTDEHNNGENTADKVKGNIFNAIFINKNMDNCGRFTNSAKQTANEKSLTNVSKIMTQQVPKSANIIVEPAARNTITAMNEMPVNEISVASTHNNELSLTCTNNSTTGYDIVEGQDYCKSECVADKIHELSINSTGKTRSKCVSEGIPTNENIEQIFNDVFIGKDNHVEYAQIDMSNAIYVPSDDLDCEVVENLTELTKIVGNDNIFEYKQIATVNAGNISNEDTVVEMMDTIVKTEVDKKTEAENNAKENEVEQFFEINVNESRSVKNAENVEEKKLKNKYLHYVDHGLANEYTKLENEQDACCLCYKIIEIYAIGECDHCICYECATRLRVICKDRYCPICRTLLHKVIFSAEKVPFRNLNMESWRNQKYIRKYSIALRGTDIYRKFMQLLKHRCPKCDMQPYDSFDELEAHLNNKHKLYFCHICTQHLKQFSFERVCYTQVELKLHLDVGDVANTSFRGHPKCIFCRTRFLDKDELFKHMRQRHYHCHFCEDTTEFFFLYSELAKHFRKKHFLCEYGACKKLQFINAFSTEIEYKAHLAREHSEEFNKYENKNIHKISVKTLFEPPSANISQSIDTYTNNEILLPSTSSAATTQYKGKQCINLGSNSEFPPLNGVTGITVPNVFNNFNTKREHKKTLIEAFPPLETVYKKTNVVTAKFKHEEPTSSSCSSNNVFRSNAVTSSNPSPKPNTILVIRQANPTTQMATINAVTVPELLFGNERKDMKETKKNTTAAFSLTEKNFPSLSAHKKSSKENKNQK